MRFDLQLLGTNAALPLYGRHTTAQVLTVESQSFLIDCGEGTQMQMESFKVKRHKIHQIFISHLHGDHIFGLWGLLTSYSLNSRKKKLQIFSPSGLEEIIMPALTIGGADLGFEIEFVVVNPIVSELIFDNSLLEVYTIPLLHRIPTCGYLFKEKPRAANIISAQIQKYGLSVPQILAAKAGETVVLDDGQELPASELTKPAPPPRSFAFCSDTRYTESIVPIIKGVDLLYHESTFCEPLKAKAIATMHSTAKEAALIAQKAKVGKLILGHYSARYPDPQELELEARTVFQESYAGVDGMVVEIPFRQRGA
ncbi:MAG: ribonuclease Z [Saprospiraceae bacterium]